MGTSYLVRLVLETEEDGVKWRDFQPKVDQKLETINDLMSTYRPNSAISQFNRKIDTKFYPVAEEFYRVVATALKIGIQTQGAFDMTLGPLIDLWGFDKTARRPAAPTTKQINEFKSFVGLDKLVLQEGGFKKTDGRVQINLSGIAKGYAVDAVTRLLDEAGAKRYMVEIGGEIAVKGKNAFGKAWNLGINRPTPEASRFELIETVRMSHGAMATSGSYRNFFNHEGRRYHHIIDPRTGEPVEHALVSVTVIAANCMVADALATASMVLGQQGFEQVLQRHFPEASALFVHQNKTEFKVSRTANFPKKSGDQVTQ